MRLAATRYPGSPTTPTSPSCSRSTRTERRPQPPHGAAHPDAGRHAPARGGAARPAPRAPSACHGRGMLPRSMRAAATPGSSSEARASPCCSPSTTPRAPSCMRCSRPAEDARGYFLLMEQVRAAQASRSPSIAIATPSSGPPPSSAREARRRPSSRGRWRSWAIGPPDLRPLTAGQGPGGAHGGHARTAS